MMCIPFADRLMHCKHIPEAIPAPVQWYLHVNILPEIYPDYIKL